MSKLSKCVSQSNREEIRGDTKIDQQLLNDIKTKIKSNISGFITSDPLITIYHSEQLLHFLHLHFTYPCKSFKFLIAFVIPVFLCLAASCHTLNPLIDDVLIMMLFFKRLLSRHCHNSTPYLSPAACQIGGSYLLISDWKGWIVNTIMLVCLILDGLVCIFVFVQGVLF